jgi:hypothetical protein
MELIMSRDDHLQRAVLEELNWEPSVTAAWAAPDSTSVENELGIVNPLLA